MLEHAGMKAWLAAVYGKDYSNYAFLDEFKPRSGLLKEILKVNEYTECYVIGNSPADILAARGAGCKNILINGNGKKELTHSSI